MSHISILQFHTANCKNCYKCIRNCPVKAIRVKNQQAQIIEEQCILCEKCTSVCPQHAKVEHNDIPDIQREIAAGKKVIASVHPAYLVRYGWNSIRSLEKCLQKMGFWKVLDAAQGAFMMKEKYTQLLEIQQQKKLVISSNCPVIVRMIEKKYPRMTEYLAPVYSMMQMHTEYLKEQYPEAILVYVSPCISVMSELKEPQAHMDYVITFRELSNWMNDVPENYSEEGEKKEVYLSRMTAISGGLIQTMSPVAGQKYLSVDGIDQCKEILRELQTGGYDTCRAKAIAVIQGKAEVSMCIPYMREKQEDYANIIINAMPGLLVTVDYDLNIVQLNKAANDLFDITRKKHLLGKQVDDYAMVNMIAFEREIVQDCIYLEEQKRYIERVLTNDRKNKLILCIMKDVTKEKEREKKQKRVKINAVQMADKLAEEQLRIVHEIASLLGETAADTKVAVEDMKQTILQEIK